MLLILLLNFKDLEFYQENIINFSNIHRVMRSQKHLTTLSKLLYYHSILLDIQLHSFGLKNEKYFEIELVMEIAKLT